MNELISTLRGVVTLDQATYERLRDRRDAMRRGVLILLIAFLVAGSLQFIVNLAGNLQPFSSVEAGQFRQEFLDGFESFQRFLPEGDAFTQEFREQFLANFEAGLTMGMEIDALPTPLPRGLARFFQSLGAWISQPLNHLAGWLFYAIWVLLFARLLGGRGGIDRFLGLTALYAVPNLLAFLRPIPYLGPALAFAGTLWGIAVYVRAVQVSQRLDLGKAVLASVLPALLLLLLLVLGMVFLVLVIVISAAGG